MGAAPFGVRRLARLTRRGHRLYLFVATVVAGTIGLSISLLVLQILRTSDVFCDATRNGVVCPDGITYALPGLGIAVGLGTLLLAVAVIDLTRRLPLNRRAPLAVDLARLAALPMLLAGIAFVCVFLMSPSLNVLGYAILLFAGAVAPVQARKYGEAVFVATACALALVAFVVAFPAVLVAPLLGGYGIVLLLAAGVASSHRLPGLVAPATGRPTDPSVTEPAE